MLLSIANEADKLTEAVPLRARPVSSVVWWRSNPSKWTMHSSTLPLRINSLVKPVEVLWLSMLAFKWVRVSYPGQLGKAAEVLTQVQQIAQGLKAAPQERQICAAAQAHFNQQQVEPALQAAQRALQISHATKDRRTLPTDLYNVGFFQLVLKNPSESVALLSRHYNWRQKQPWFCQRSHVPFGTGAIASR